MGFCTGDCPCGRACARSDDFCQHHDCKRDDCPVRGPRTRPAASRTAAEPEKARCNACEIERLGCGCDGSLDDGCFLCTPESHTRPPCPPTCPNYRPTLWERISKNDGDV